MEEITAALDRLMAGSDYDGAESLLRGELEKARYAGDASRELSILNELLGFCRLSRREAGFQDLLDRTLALLDGERVPPVSRGTILINAATALAAFDRGREALPLYERAAACLGESLGPRDLLFAALYNNMAAALDALGDKKGAEDYYRRGLAVMLGYPHHPDTAVSWVNLAQHYASVDPADPRVGEDLDKAMAVFDDPVMLWDGYYAHTAIKCAGAFEDLGQPERGRDLRERAGIIYEGT